MGDNLRTIYEARLPLLQYVAKALERETGEYISDLPDEIRVVFTVMDTKKFLTRAKQVMASDAGVDPLIEIEDQITGKITISPEELPAQIEQHLKDAFTAVQGEWQDADKADTQGFPTRRLVCLIPPQVKPPGWDARHDVPKTFELQIQISVGTAIRQTGVNKTSTGRTMPTEPNSQESEFQSKSADPSSQIGVSKPRNAASWLLEAVRQVPDMKYAVAVVGIAAAASISLGFFWHNYLVAVFGSVAVFAGMLLVRLYVTAQFKQKKAVDPSGPLQVIIWAVTAAIVCIIALGVVCIGISIAKWAVESFRPHTSSGAEKIPAVPDQIDSPNHQPPQSRPPAEKPLEPKPPGKEPTPEPKPPETEPHPSRVPLPATTETDIGVKPLPFNPDNSSGLRPLPYKPREK